MRARLLCVAVAAAVAALTVGCQEDEPADLIVVSPHNKFIQQEFESAFLTWHRERFDREIAVQWRDVGGTKQITKYLKAQYDRSGSSGIDIYFGGGAPDHKFLARHECLEPIELPAETLKEIPVSVLGVQWRDTRAGWYGACLSSFGILYNAKLFEEKKLPVPTTWDDLAHPRLRGWVSAAGPDSGSAIAAYEMMLQTAGDWPTGWRRLLAFWGNCRTFTQGASEVPGRIKDGQELAGAVIDFYAFTEMAGAAPGVLKFVVPAGGEVFTPDPISVLKGAPHRQAAQRFVQFVLSKRGQALWCLPAGAEGGPKDHTLYRQPIRRDVYPVHKGKMQAGLVDVFELAEVTGKQRPTLDDRLQDVRATHILPRLMRAAAIDNAVHLRKAWEVIVSKGQPAELMSRFGQLPGSLATVKDLWVVAEQLDAAEKRSDAKMLELMAAEWREHWRLKYKQIIEEE